MTDASGCCSSLSGCSNNREPRVEQANVDWRMDRKKTRVDVMRKISKRPRLGLVGENVVKDAINERERQCRLGFDQV